MTVAITNEAPLPPQQPVNTANRQQDQNSGQIRQQVIQGRAETVQAGTTARQSPPNAQPSQASKGEWKPIEIPIARGVDGSKEGCFF